MADRPFKGSPFDFNEYYRVLLWNAYTFMESQDCSHPEPEGLVDFLASVIVSHTFMDVQGGPIKINYLSKREIDSMQAQSETSDDLEARISTKRIVAEQYLLQAGLLNYPELIEPGKKEYQKLSQILKKAEHSEEAMICKAISQHFEYAVLMLRYIPLNSGFNRLSEDIIKTFYYDDTNNHNHARKKKSYRNNTAESLKKQWEDDRRGLDTRERNEKKIQDKMMNLFDSYRTLKSTNSKKLVDELTNEIEKLANYAMKKKLCPFGWGPHEIEKNIKEWMQSYQNQKPQRPD